MSGRRAALVTGAARGIGRAIAQRLSDDGLDVLACDLEPDAAGPGVPHVADLATREGNRGAVAAALERFGRLDAVVANAGLQHVAPVEEFDEDKWDQLLAVLLTSPFLLAKHAWPALRESGALHVDPLARRRRAAHDRVDDTERIRVSRRSAAARPRLRGRRAPLRATEPRGGSG